MTYVIDWALPNSLKIPRVHSCLSNDWQIYGRCRKCRADFHIDPFYLPKAEANSSLHCPHCNDWTIDVVNYLVTMNVLCDRCKAFRSERGLDIELFSCLTCGRHSLRGLPLRCDEFPRTFVEYKSAKATPWGRNPHEDGNYLVKSLSFAVPLPDFSLHLLSAVRFCERLRRSGVYQTANAEKVLAAIEGNLYRDYFRRTGALAAGFTALDLFLEACQWGPDALNRGLMNHNVGIIILSLMIQYPEGTLSAIAGVPSLRRIGIAACRQAVLDYAEAEEGELLSLHRARLMWTLADLLHRGAHEVDQDEIDKERAEALHLINEAIACTKVDEGLRAHMIESRVGIVVDSRTATTNEIDQAILDLEHAARTVSGKLTAHGARAEWTVFANLARMHERRGNVKAAMTWFERAQAAVTGHLRMLSGAPELLATEIVRYGSLCDALIDIFIQGGRPAEGVALAEEIRGAAVRAWTMSAVDRQQVQADASEKIIRRALNHFLGASASERRPDPSLIADSPPAGGNSPPWDGTDILRRLAAHPGDRRSTVLVSYGMGNGWISSVVWRPTPTSFEVKGKRWPVSPEHSRRLATYQQALHLGPFRRRRLEEVTTAIFDLLIAPMLELLEGATDLGVCTPGVLDVLPFEAALVYGAGFMDVSLPMRAFYSPSMTILNDLATRQVAPRTGRLLVVDYADGDLPGTAEEVRELVSLWGDRCVHLQSDRCSKEKIVSELANDYDYIHLACHGSFNELDPLNSMLHFDRSGTHGRSLSARDVMALRLSTHPVVTLSACESAMGSRDLSNVYLGLAGSFLRAGAQAAIASRWSVYDDSTCAMMQMLYRRLHGGEGTAFDSLCEVQQANRYRGVDEWAAFAYVGLP
jgi:hypothetical protein